MITDSKLSLVKIGEMQQVSDKIVSASQKFNVKDLENKTGQVLAKSQDLYNGIVKQQRALEVRIIKSFSIPFRKWL